MKKIYKILIVLLLIVCAYSTYHFASGRMETYTKTLNLWRMEGSSTSNEGKSISPASELVSSSTGKMGMAREILVTGFVAYADRDDWSFTDGVGNDKPFSVAYWMYLNTTATSQFVGKRTITSSTVNPEWASLILSNQHMRLQVFNDLSSTNYKQCETSGGVFTGNWYHIAMTYDGEKASTTGLKIYIDGVNKTFSCTRVGSYASGMTNGGGTLNLFRSATSYMVGKIDELGIYNTELSESNIRRIMVGLHPF